MACRLSIMEQSSPILVLQGQRALTESEFQKLLKNLFSDPQESIVKKMSFDGSGPPKKMRPKTCQKIFPARAWDHLNIIFL